ncbi:MAG: NRDE family protein [Planctomycetes bacterium]|nr:NRDE family protein [Planctomycetota bacterium]
MCSLIVLRGLTEAHPLFVAANRDERTDRKASPPGIWHGERRRILSPRDRVAGGTWLAVDVAGRFAGLTNVFGQPAVDGAPSRGHLPHLVLDHDDLQHGVDAVLARVAERPHSAFQLVAADAERMFVIRHVAGDVRCVQWSEPVVALTNEHEAGTWSPRGLAPSLEAGLSAEQRLDALADCVRDRGGDGFHAVCKHGDDYGTVSSSLLALPRDDVAGLIWRYAPGPPDVTDYRNYSNLAARLRG